MLVGVADNIEADWERARTRRSLALIHCRSCAGIGAAFQLTGKKIQNGSAFLTRVALLLKTQLQLQNPRNHAWMIKSVSRSELINKFRGAKRCVFRSLARLVYTVRHWKYKTWDKAKTYQSEGLLSVLALPRFH